MMKPTATLTNIARGGLVDDAALAEALRDKRIGAAGLDVFEGEPTVHPGLLEASNIVLTPHIGSASLPTRRAMANLAVDNLIATLGSAALAAGPADCAESRGPRPLVRFLREGPRPPPRPCCRSGLTRLGGRGRWPHLRARRRLPLRNHAMNPHGLELQGHALALDRRRWGIGIGRDRRPVRSRRLAVPRRTRTALADQRPRTPGCVWQ
jgi:hypothetical protein